MALIAIPSIHQAALNQVYLKGAEMDEIISHLSSNVEALEIWAQYTPDYAAFSKLKKIELMRYIDHTGWKLLSTCTQLEIIELWADPGDETLEPCSVTFPSLRTLTISATAADQYAQFTREIVVSSIMPLLQELWIGWDAQMDQRAIRHHLPKWSPLLKTIHWRSYGPGEDLAEWAERDAEMGEV